MVAAFEEDFDIEMKEGASMALKAVGAVVAFIEKML